jgi:hypothetical protein
MKPGLVLVLVLVPATVPTQVLARTRSACYCCHHRRHRRRRPNSEITGKLRACEFACLRRFDESEDFTVESGILKHGIKLPSQRCNKRGTLHAYRLGIGSER